MMKLQRPAPYFANALLAAGFRKPATVSNVTWLVLLQFALVAQACQVVQTPQ